MSDWSTEPVRSERPPTEGVVRRLPTLAAMPLLSRLPCKFPPDAR